MPYRQIHPFFELEPTEVLDHHIIFALTLAKQHDGELASRSKAIQLGEKAPAHLPINAEDANGWPRWSRKKLTAP